MERLGLGCVALHQKFLLSCFCIVRNLLSVSHSTVSDSTTFFTHTNQNIAFGPARSQRQGAQAIEQNGAKPRPKLDSTVLSRLRKVLNVFLIRRRTEELFAIIWPRSSC